MTIYTALKRDHRKVLSLIDTLLASEHEALKVRRDLVSKISAELIPHSRAEEALLYNSLRDSGQNSKVVASSYLEHLETEALLRSLAVMEVVDVHWTSGIRKLQATLTEHIRNEEGPVFTQAREIISSDEAEQIGKAFLRLKSQIKKGNFATSTCELVTNLMPEKLRPGVKNFLSSISGISSTPVSKAS